jgi:hypothetical protein
MTNKNNTTEESEIEVSTTKQPLEQPPKTAGISASRRGLLKGIGTTTATIAVGGTGLTYAATEEADAIAPVLFGSGLIAAAGLGYLVGAVVDYHNTGPDRDLSGYTGGDALHSAQEEDVLELQGTEQEVLTEVRNMIERGEVAATMDGKKAFIEAYNRGDTKSECQTAAENAGDDFWSNRQQSIVTRWYQACNLIRRRYAEVESNSDLNMGDVWTAYEGSGDGEVAFERQPNSNDFREATFTTFNGTEVTYTYCRNFSDYHNWSHAVDPFGQGDGGGVRHGRFEFLKFSSNSPITALSTSKYVQIMDRIVTARDRTIGNMATYVDEAFSALERGEVSTDDLLNHYDIQQEFSTNKEDSGYHGWLAWEFYSLGMETDLQHNAVLSFPESDSPQLEGTLFVSSADPIGGTIDAGTTYDPTQWGGESAFFTYSRVVTDKSDIAEQEEIAKEHSDGSYTVIGKIQIKEKFVVEKLYNVQTGDEIDSTTTEKTNDQNYDPEQLQAEIDRLNEQITEMQENAEAEESGDGGSGIPSPEISLLQGTGIVGLGLSVLYALSGRSDDKPPGRGR